MENPEHPCEHLGTATQAIGAEFIPGGAKLRKNVRQVPRAVTESVKMATSLAESGSARRISVSAKAIPLPSAAILRCVM